jgi:hypothetical protein
LVAGSRALRWVVGQSDGSTEAGQRTKRTAGLFLVFRGLKRKIPATYVPVRTGRIAILLVEIPFYDFPLAKATTNLLLARAGSYFEIPSK